MMSTRFPIWNPPNILYEPINQIFNDLSPLFMLHLLFYNFSLCTCKPNLVHSLTVNKFLCLISDSIAGPPRRWIPNNDLKSQARRNNRIRSPSPPFFIHQESTLPCPLAVIKHTNKNWRKACNVLHICLAMCFCSITRVFRIFFVLFKLSFTK